MSSGIIARVFSVVKGASWYDVNKVTNSYGTGGVILRHVQDERRVRECPDRRYGVIENNGKAGTLLFTAGRFKFI